MWQKEEQPSQGQGPVFPGGGETTFCGRSGGEVLRAGVKGQVTIFPHLNFFKPNRWLIYLSTLAFF